MVRVARQAVRVIGLACWLAASSAAVEAQNEVVVGVGGPMGAAGDGLTDDTAVIQAALNAVPAGGTVTLEAGRAYRINLSIGLRPKSYTRLNLHGATLSAAAGQGGRFIDLTSKVGVVVSGGTLLGNGATASPAVYGVLGSNSSDLVFEDMVFQDLYGDGILLTGSPGGERISVRGTRFAACRRAGVYVAAGRQISIDHSTFENIRGLVPEAGVHLTVNAGTVVEHVRVSRSTFRNNGVAVSAVKANGTRLGHLSVSDNTIENNVRGVTVTQASHVIVDGNRISGHSGPTGDAVSLATGTTNATVSGNVLSNNFKGIHAFGASTVNVTGNTVLGTGPRAGQGAGNGGDGITCAAPPTAYVTQCVVVGNVVTRSAGVGIRFARGSLMIASNNVVTESGQHGIVLGAVVDSQVRGNTVSRSSLEHAKGYDDLQVVAGSQRNVVTLNQCRLGTGARASIYVDAGSAHTLVAQNSLLGGAGFQNYSTTTSVNWDGSGANWNR